MNNKKKYIIILLLIALIISIIVAFIFDKNDSVKNKMYISQGFNNDIYRLTFEDAIVVMDLIRVEKTFLKQDIYEEQYSLNYDQDDKQITIQGIDVHLPVKEETGTIQKNKIVYKGFDEEINFIKSNNEDWEEMKTEIKRKVDIENETIEEVNNDLQMELEEKSEIIEMLNDEILDEFRLAESNINYMELNMQNIERTLKIYEEEKMNLDKSCERDSTYCEVQDILDLVSEYELEINKRQAIRTDKINEIKKEVEKFNELLEQNEGIEGSLNYSGLDFLTEHNQWIDDKLKLLNEQKERINKKTQLLSP